VLLRNHGLNVRLCSSVGWWSFTVKRFWSFMVFMNACCYNHSLGNTVEGFWALWDICYCVCVRACVVLWICSSFLTDILRVLKCIFVNVHTIGYCLTCTLLDVVVLFPVKVFGLASQIGGGGSYFRETGASLRASGMKLVVAVAVWCRTRGELSGMCSTSRIWPRLQLRNDICFW
jgi:hypothetical protein